MVFRTFARFSRYTKSCCHTKCGYQPPFFNPSYRGASEVARLEEVAHQKGSRNNTKGSYQTIVPVLTLTKNYVIFDPQHQKRDDSSESEEDEDKDKFRRVMLKRVSRNAGGNGHMKVNLTSMNSRRATFNVRRKNSTAVHTLVLPTILQTSETPAGARAYSTKPAKADLDKLTHELSKLKVEQQTAEATPEQVVSEPVASPRTLVESPVNSADIHAVEMDRTVPLESTSMEGQCRTIDSMLSVGKYNEILALFYHMRGKNEVPALNVYNKVLKSVGLRETDETCEQHLTHLLNVYSDMLSNNVKPNADTYEFVVGPLLKGSMRSHSEGHFKEGRDFLKIAIELFMISHGNSELTFKDCSIYNDLLKCVNCYNMTDTPVAALETALIQRVTGSADRCEMYIALIKLAGKQKDALAVMNLYKQLQESDKKGPLQKQQYNIYCTVIEALNLCGEVERSAAMLDQVVSAIEDKKSGVSQRNISRLLSSYVQSLAWTDPEKACESLVRFNQINWLPDVSIACLANLFASLLEHGSVNMATKAWNFAIIREDFDEGIKGLSSSLDSNYLQVQRSLDIYIDALLRKQNKSNIIKTVREILLKESLVVSDQALVELLTYLQNEQYYALANTLICDQGNKRGDTKRMTLNNYLSLVVDFVTKPQLEQLFGTVFFKKTVEQYRLVRDNVYGLIKVYEQLLSNMSSEQKRLKLAYYTKVLSYEMDDVSNYYVALPKELKAFKIQLNQLQHKLAI